MTADRLVLRLATRKSALALAQARAWAQTLVAKRPDVSVEEVHVTTTGDRIQDRAASTACPKRSRRG